MQALFLAFQIVVGAAAHALGTEGDPLQQNVPHAQHLGLATDQHVKVAGEAVLQRCGLEQAGHELIRVLPALEVDGQFQTIQVGLIAHVADFTDLAQFDQFSDLIHDRFDGSRGRNSRYIDAIVFFVVAPLGADTHTTAAFFQHILHLGRVVQDGAAAHKIGGGDDLPQVSLGVFHQGDGGVAQFLQVEGADIGGHTDRDAQRIVSQNGGEGDRQQGRFCRCTVIVWHKVDGVLVDVAEQFVTDGFQLGLSITGGGVGHIAAVRLAEVTFGVDKRHQQALVGAAHTHHRIVDGSIAVGVQVHGAAHDVGTFGAVALEQAHAVHGIQQLAVRRFEAVDLRQSAGDDDAHGVGHIVGFQRIGDGRFQHLARREDLDVIAQLGPGGNDFLFFSFCHRCFSLLSLHPNRPDTPRRVRRYGLFGLADCRPAAGQKLLPCARHRWAVP